MVESSDTKVSSDSIIDCLDSSTRSRRSMWQENTKDGVSVVSESWLHGNGVWSGLVTGGNLWLSIPEAQPSSFRVGKVILKNPFLDTLRSGVSFKSYMAGLFSFDVVGWGIHSECKIYCKGVHGGWLLKHHQTTMCIFLQRNGQNIPGMTCSASLTNRTHYILVAKTDTRTLGRLNGLVTQFFHCHSHIFVCTSSNRCFWVRYGILPPLVSLVLAPGRILVDLQVTYKPSL